MKNVKKYVAGIVLTIGLALLSQIISSFIPKIIISPGVFALILGMLLNPVIRRIWQIRMGY